MMVDELNLRSAVNSCSFVKSKIQESSNKWNRLCVCMDSIEDTFKAIKHYLDTEKIDGYNGSGYIYIYGALQALFIQQDAFDHCISLFNNSFGWNIDEFKSRDSIKEIRTIRNKAVGHPTERLVMINRGSISKEKFQILLIQGNSKIQFEDIDINQAIEDQIEAVRKEDNELSEKIKKEELVHRNKFKDTKMLNIFKGYEKYLQTMSVAIENPKRGIVELKLLIKMIDDFKLNLKKRIISHEYIVPEELTYATNWLLNYFENRPDLGLDDSLPIIITGYLRSEFPNLIEHANEIDNKYASNELV